MKSKTKESPHVKLLFKIVKEETRYSKQDIVSKYRIRELVTARIITAKIMKDMLKHTSIAVAYLVNRDHATILYYLKSHDSLHQTDKTYREMYDKVAYRMTIDGAESESPSVVIDKLKALLKRILDNDNISMDNRRASEQLL